MSRIFPVIKNGKYRLLVSETVVLIPEFGLQIGLPIAEGKTIDINFVFLQELGSPGRYATEVDGPNLVLKLVNFVNALGAGLNSPIEFAIGASKFYLQLYGEGSHSGHLCLSMSIYSMDSLNA